MSETDFVDLYQVLNVSRDASEDEIRDAVKAQRKIWIQRTLAPSLERRQEAERQVALIARAAQVLLDPAARAQHNRDLDDQARAGQAHGARPVPDQGSALDDWAGEAQEALARGDVAKAQWLAGEATRHNSQDPAAWAVRGRADMGAGDYQSATFAFERARGLDPDSAELAFELGSVLQARREWGQALTQYQNAVSLAPDEPYYRVALGRNFIDSGATGPGLQILEPLAQQHPQDGFIQTSLAWALTEAGLDHWQRMPDGLRFPIQREQAEQSLAIWRRAEALTIQDDSIRDELRRRIERAEWALRRSWTMSARKFILLVITSLFVASILDFDKPFLWFLVFAACIVGIVALARKPNYRTIRMDVERKYGRVR